MRKRSSQPAEFNGKANQGERQRVLPGELLRSRWKKFEQRSQRDRDSKEHRSIDPEKFSARNGKHKIRAHKHSRSKHANGVALELLLQHLGCAKAEEPVRREQQSEAGEGAGHVSANARRDGEMSCDKPEGEQKERVEESGKRHTEDRLQATGKKNW